MVNIGQETKIVFPKLHDYQRQVAEDQHRYKVMAMGRRGGKSWLAKQILLEKAVNEGKKVWFVSLTFTNVMDHWREAKVMVGKLATYVNERDKLMQFDIQGRHGSIQFKSANNPENLLGSGLDYVVLDEAAYMDESVWAKTIRPMLSDRKGGAIFISSPNGTANWFYRIYLRGQSDHPDDVEWKSWRFRTIDNPLIAPSEVEAAKQDLTDLMFRQEYLAEFVSDAGGVFRGLDRIATLDPLDYPVENHIYIAGIDWGRRNDYTVISIFDRDTREQVWIDRFTEIGWAVQRDRLMALYEKWKFVRVYAEANSIGAVNIEELQSSGMPVESIYMTNIMKTSLVERLAGNVERGNIRFISPSYKIGEVQIGELQSYSIQRTKGNTLLTYSAPTGFHDDIVVADLMVNIGMSDMYSGKVKISENPFYGPKRTPVIDPEAKKIVDKQKLLQSLNDRKKKYATSN